ITASNPFKWRHYPGDIILWCVRWYLRFPISFAHMAEMALERGLLIHSSCIWRWVQIYGPELDKRCRAHLKPTNRSYRVDEPTSGSKGRNDSCIGPWIPQGRPSISCSRPNAMLQQPSDSFVRCCSTQPIRSLGSSTWTRTERIRRPWTSSKWKAHFGAAADYASAST